MWFTWEIGLDMDSWFARARPTFTRLLQARDLMQFQHIWLKCSFVSCVARDVHKFDFRLVVNWTSNEGNSFRSEAREVRIVKHVDRICKQVVVRRRRALRVCLAGERTAQYYCVSATMVIKKKHQKGEQSEKLRKPFELSGIKDDWKVWTSGWRLWFARGQKNTRI